MAPIDLFNATNPQPASRAFSMLPQIHHQGDQKYIQSQLIRLPYSYRARACEGYSKAWQEAHDIEPEMRHKENRARFAANTRLREFTEKVLAR